MNNGSLLPPPGTKFQFLRHPTFNLITTSSELRKHNEVKMALCKFEIFIKKNAVIAPHSSALNGEAMDLEASSKEYELKPMH